MKNKIDSKLISGVECVFKVSKGRKLRITISPKTSQVILHIPKIYSETEAIIFFQENINWIKENQAKVKTKIESKEKKSQLKNGSVVNIWGEPYLVKIIKEGKRSSYEIIKETIIIKEAINVEPKDVVKVRNLVLSRLHKKELQIFIDEILSYWEKTMQEKPTKIRYRDMKSKWGTCNTQNGIVTLNTRLAEYPCECAEMVLVHELVHFKERLHNYRFKKFMTKYLPDWKDRVKMLNY